MNRITKAILLGIFAAILTLVIDILEPFHTFEYERLFNILTIIILITSFSYLIAKIDEKKNLNK